MVGRQAGLTHPSRRGPSQHLGRQGAGRAVAAAARGDQRLAVAEGPGLQQIAVGQAEFEAFVRQFLRLVPSARQPAVKTEMIQGRDQRSDSAALPAFVHHPPQRLPAAGLPGPLTLDRWIIDLAAGKVTQQRLDDRPQEFPASTNG
jgi:hypothetical protein